MKTLMLFIALTAAALARAAEPEPKTDEQINREAAIAVAKAVALRKMQAEQSASAKIESKRVFDAAIDAMVTIFQVVPSQGILAKPILAQRGPPHLVRISHHEMVQGTGLDSHKQVAHDWVEVREERERVSLDELIWIAMPTEGLIDDRQAMVTIWPADPYHYSTAVGAGKTVSGFTTIAPKK